MQGLQDAVGTDIARILLKGYQVHCNRSWQRIRDHIVSSKEKTLRQLSLTLMKLSNTQY